MKEKKKQRLKYETVNVIKRMKREKQRLDKEIL